MTIEEVVELMIEEKIMLKFRDENILNFFCKACDSMNYNCDYAKNIIKEDDGVGFLYFRHKKNATSGTIVSFEVFCKLTGFKLKIDETPTLKEEIIRVFKKIDDPFKSRFYRLNDEEKNIVNCFKLRNESLSCRKKLDDWWKDTFYEKY